MLNTARSRDGRFGICAGAFFGAAAMVFVGVVSSPFALQAQGTSPNANSNPSAAICMSRAVPEELEGIASEVPVVVPARDVGGMVAKGFRVSGCKKFFASTEAQIAWRDEVCAIAALNYTGQAESFERRVGERPSVLCGLAQVALGPRSRGSN
ncbi:hypothetical protein ACFCW2_03735 [Qipengyuania sp. DSG2-2]|uniref:hypothetical protein n=1 Tax=Qipengyuania sp. DGS2-2 TaxID=3349631 RepID=UPI0036D20C58